MIARTKNDTYANAEAHRSAKDRAQLTFAALDAQIDALPQPPEGSTVLPLKTQWGFGVAIAGALFALLSARLLPIGATCTGVFNLLGVTIEIGGGLVAILSQMPREWLTFGHQRRVFAEQIDFDLPHHLALIDWLRTFPRDQREVRGEFAAYRHARMKEKLPLLTGSIEKLGALPIVIALFLQFKDMRWPPHPGWLEIALIVVLVFAYWLSVSLVIVRVRLQLYETLLGKSLAQIG